MRVDFIHKITGFKHNYYMDDKLYREITGKVIPSLRKKDEDWVIVVDGAERAGKSTLALQLASAVDNSFELSRLCFTPDEFKRAILGAEKGQAVVFDEAYRGLGSRGALTEVNRILTSLMMEMGQKNLFIIIVLPSFFLLEKYVALWRARGLFHVFQNRGKKGFWRYYNKKKKKYLYLKGKSLYDYSGVKTGFKGRFFNYYPVDEAEYRAKKSVSLKDGFKTTKDTNYQAQRNKLLNIMYKELPGCTQQGLSDLLLRYDMKLSRIAINNILKKFKEND